MRNLEREIAAVARKVARRLAEGQRDPVRITAANLVEYLGRPRFFDEVAERTARPGVATGLAWTPTGGDVLFVEVTMMPSSEERLVLTGMLGDVMRESAQAAVSYVWSNAEALGIDPKLFEGKTIHVHVPAGAIPKDGPSAGVTIVTALASLATRRPVRSDLAMTGEITLRGKVLPVGGIKEKVLAAHRVGHPHGDPAEAERARRRGRPGGTAPGARPSSSSTTPGDGPAHHGRGGRAHPDRYHRATVSGRGGRALVCGHRIRPHGGRGGHGRPVAAAGFLPHVHLDVERAADPPG